MTPPVPIRIAYLVSQYPATNHTFILREIRALRARGFDVPVISIRGADRSREKLSDIEREEQDRTWVVFSAGVGAILKACAATLFRHPSTLLGAVTSAVRLARGDFRKLLANLAYLGEAITVGNRLERLGIRHVHSHFTSTVALFLARVFSITFSVTFHGPDEFNDVRGFYVAEKVAESLFVCAISSYARSQLMKASDSRYWEKIEVVPLGVDYSVFAPRPQRTVTDRFEILSVGRLAPAKAQHVLIQAVEMLLREGRHIHLRLVGEGPDRCMLENQIVARGVSGYVTLEGACNQDKVLAFYRQTDLFALASFAEGVPVVLMEAMSMEIPSLATWITGIPELIRHGIDGWLVAPADPHELAAAIRILMDDDELRQRLGKAGRLRVKEKYDLTANSARLAETYRRWLAVT